MSIRIIWFLSSHKHQKIETERTFQTIYSTRLRFTRLIESFCRPERAFYAKNTFFQTSANRVHTTICHKPAQVRAQRIRMLGQPHCIRWLSMLRWPASATTDSRSCASQHGLSPQSSRLKKISEMSWSRHEWKLLYAQMLNTCLGSLSDKPYAIPLPPSNLQAPAVWNTCPIRSQKLRLGRWSSVTC